MRRNSKKLFKIISPFACICAASVPLAITLTSCSTSSGGLKSLNTAQSAALPTSLKSTTFTNTSVDIVSLLNGDADFHEGNYCIVIGSNVSRASNKWFCGASGTGGTEGSYYENYYAANAFQGSFFLDAYEQVQAYAKNKDCAMLTFLDIQDAGDKLSNEVIGEQYFPFDYKWTDAEQKKAETWDDEKDTNLASFIIKDHYARNDKSAKDMRSLIALCEKLFGDNFKDVKSDSLPFVMTWKEGVPQKNGFGKLTDAASFQSKVIEVWEKEEEKK